MDKYELENFMENKKNFDLWAVTTNPIGEPTFRYLSRDGNPDRVINCIVDLSDNTFQFKFLVPYTVFTLESGKFSPITNEKHFDKTLNRFMKQVDKLLEGI